MSSQHRSKLIFGWVTFATLVLVIVITVVTNSWSQSIEPKFPQKPITIIAPFDAGGNVDTIGRFLAEGAKKYFPEPVVVVNRPGAGGVVGTAELVRSTPDGYTILIGVNSNLAQSIHMVKTPYTIDDYIPIMRVAQAPSVLYVNSRSPWRNIKELVGYAKEHPGEIRVGSPGIGTISHLSIEILASLANVKFTHIPFTGNTPAVTALLGENIEMVSVYPVEGIPHVKAGVLRAVAVFSRERVKVLKDVPTLMESGYNIGWWGSTYSLVAPKGTPERIVQILHDYFKRVLDDPFYKESLEKTGSEPVYLNSKDTAKDLLDFYVESGKIINRLGLGLKK
jgi:tripartite-type tricarboxylate transporter receptor subunit TctC